MARGVQYEVEWDSREWYELYGELFKRVHDLRPVFRKAEKDLKQSWVTNFTTQGSLVGGWKPLDTQYAAWKAREYPGAPILVQGSRLFRSIQRLSVRRINRKSATFGTNNKVAQFHQYGTRNMASREIIFEPPLFAQKLAKYTAEYLEDGD